MSESFNIKRDIVECPNCGKTPLINEGVAQVMHTKYTIPTYGIYCCGINGKSWVSKSWAILHWNLKALARPCQLMFNV